MVAFVELGMLTVRRADLVPVFSFGENDVSAD